MKWTRAIASWRRSLSADGMNGCTSSPRSKMRSQLSKRSSVHSPMKSGSHSMSSGRAFSRSGTTSDARLKSRSASSAPSLPRSSPTRSRRERCGSSSTGGVASIRPLR